MSGQSVTLMQITRVAVSIILLCVGILLFTNVLDAGDPRYWVGIVMVLAAVFTSTISPTITFVLIGIGGYLLLRDFGVISTPWLGFGISLMLVAVGIYGIFASLRMKPEKTPNAQPKDTQS